MQSKLIILQNQDKFSVLSKESPYIHSNAFAWDVIKRIVTDAQDIFNCVQASGKTMEITYSFSVKSVKGGK